MSNAQTAPAPEVDTTITEEQAQNDVRLKKLNAEIERLGKESASSVLSKPHMALAIVLARQDGVIGEEDAKATYMTYLKGRASTLKGKASMGMGAGDNETTNANSLAANISKNKALLKAAGLALTPAKIDFHAVLGRAVKLRQDIIATEEDPKVKPTFDVFVDVAKAQTDQPEAELSDEQINEKIRKPEKGEKTSLDLLIDDYKRMRKRMDELPEVTQLIDVVANLADAITAMDGELPPVTDEEKKIAKANKILAGIGFKVANSNLSA